MVLLGSINPLLLEPRYKGIHRVSDHGDPCWSGAVTAGKGEEVNMPVSQGRFLQAADSLFFPLLLIFIEMSWSWAGIAGVVELVLQYV